MPSTQTLEDFYKHKLNWMPNNLQKDLGHFNVFRFEDCVGPNATTTVSYSRRNFYKISLVRGRNLCHYADKSIEVSGSTLIFFNPNIPYSWEALSEDRTGFFCIFTEEFFVDRMRGGLGELPMYQFWR